MPLFLIGGEKECRKKDTVTKLTPFGDKDNWNGKRNERK